MQENPADMDQSENPTSLNFVIPSKSCSALTRCFLASSRLGLFFNNPLCFCRLPSFLHSSISFLALFKHHSTCLEACDIFQYLHIFFLPIKDYCIFYYINKGFITLFKIF